MLFLRAEPNRAPQAKTRQTDACRQVSLLGLARGGFSGYPGLGEVAEVRGPISIKIFLNTLSLGSPSKHFKYAMENKRKHVYHLLVSYTETDICDHYNVMLYAGR